MARDELQGHAFGICSTEIPMAIPGLFLDFVGNI